MGRKNNNVVVVKDSNREPILDPIAEGIVVDEFANDVEVQDKEGD